MLTLAVDGFEFRIADAIGDGPERRTRLDRLQLLWIADKHELGASLCDGFDEQRHLPRRHHAGLVQHKDRLLIKLPSTLIPVEFPGR